MLDFVVVHYGGDLIGYFVLENIFFSIFRPDLLQIPAQATLCHLSNAVPVVGMCSSHFIFKGHVGYQVFHV